ncbi:hypothetical protein ACH5RR_020216 [Cinchona calisaya]|uniref:MULE transposase domain-containing protein n=1 Tax=Cinchona calisaya TaxID=153742 RepID=A0ABD2ZGT3_9GENT
MQKEEESDYIWALERFKKLLGVGKNPSVIVTDRELALMNAIEIVFPSTTNLLCVWHIEKNILSKCKKYFEEKEAWETFILSWTNLIKSTDEITFLKGWKLLEVDQKEQPLVLNYLENTWLPFKEKFIYAWTDKHLHFGNHNSSRAEGAHSMLKTNLQVSTGDFHEVKQKICLAIEIQYQEIKARLESERLRIPHGFRIPLFQKLISHVSVYALGQIFKQHELASRDGP